MVRLLIAGFRGRRLLFFCFVYFGFEVFYAGLCVCRLRAVGWYVLYFVSSVLRVSVLLLLVSAMIGYLFCCFGF